MHPRRFKLYWLALAIFLADGATAFGAAPAVSASGAWIRWLPGELPLAGYVIMHNNGAPTLKLIGANSPAFKRIEIHRSMSMHGMDTMKPVAAVALPAHKAFRFAPGGYHLMMWRARPLQVGDKVAVTLKFADGGKLRVTFTVKSATQ